MGCVVRVRGRVRVRVKVIVRVKVMVRVRVRVRVKPDIGGGLCGTGHDHGPLQALARPAQPTWRQAIAPWHIPCTAHVEAGYSYWGVVGC